MEVSEQIDVKSFLLADAHEPHPVPIWRETFLGVDWVKLRASRVYYGIGVPKGDKSAVILVPGFMGYDYYMVELFAWLWRRERWKVWGRLISNCQLCKAI